MTEELEQTPYEVHKTVYCQCGFPVIYCQFRSAAKSKNLGCREYLAHLDPELFAKIYGEAPPEEQPGAENAEEQDNGEEQDEESGSDSEPMVEQKLKIPVNEVPPFGIAIKLHLKRLPTYIPILEIRLASRGQHKSLTQVFNFEDFVDDPEAVCKELGRKFSASAGISQLPDSQAEVLQVEGSVVGEMKEYFIAHGVPEDQIFQAHEGKHKGKKKALKRSRPNDKR